MRTAYHDIMEFLVLLLLLFLAGDSRDYGRILKELLAFYRENRELISLLAKNFGGTPPAPPAPEEKPAEQGEEKDRPPEADDLLQQFLDRKLR